MSNKNYFFIFLSTLYLISFLNLFNDVTYEYIGYSIDFFQKFEVNCGSFINLLQNSTNDTFLNTLGAYRNFCINTAYTRILNFTIFTFFISLVLIIGIKYLKKLSESEDLSDLIMILKRRNNN